jgi:2-iminobutanoate/2-iminopropanoate deaminase
MPNRRRVFFNTSGQRHSSPIPEGVIANGFVFLTAVRGVDPNTQQVETDDAEEQARAAFAVMRNTLATVGSSVDDVVKVGVYMKDMADRDAFNKVWKETFGDEPPARFAVQVVDMGVIGDKTKFLLDVTALAPEGA